MDLEKDRSTLAPSFRRAFVGFASSAALLVSAMVLLSSVA
jgi:hypothetical protein